ncbi:eukaryotic translation initiation factor 4 gamma 1-like [Mercenaria mercenaria]|uniref:eukaryotic translation initiation factor 4 gamma 1-like n=1 Tax=Mercenaria mercenaria TaxID=6596 RepID=UPI00234F0F41|nr:eukaryotic translation initiation factor 4 gamma 1-like [Mercenaria mercenaria]
MLKNKTKEGSEGLREGTSVDGEDNETKILGLKYKYAEGQWSPLNPEGKKHYGREFLLQLQHDYNAIQKPSGLPDIPEIMLDNDKPLGKDGEMTRGNSGGQELIDFIPKYVWGGGDKKLTFGKPRSDLPESQPAPTEFTVSSEKDMEKKTKAILDKYFVTPNMKVVILSVQKVSTENHPHFVYNAINHVLKRSSQARKQTGHILRNLVKQSVISLDDYLRGLVEVLEFAEDLEISIPKIWQYYGELINPMAQDNSIFSSIKQAAAPLILDNKNGVLAVKLFYASQNEVLYKKTRSILNKLTPQKFQTLVSQMQALPIDSEEKLKGVINLVFEKAISEPSYGVAYANMCRCLSMVSRTKSCVKVY